MRALIFGLGSIGRRHLRNLRAIEPNTAICVWHSYRKETERSDISANIDQEVFCEEDALSLSADVAFITGPASQHVSTAMALAEIMAAGKTTLIDIAHRLSTIRSADQIVVMDDEKVIESGSHGGLVHDDSWYADMVRMQAVG